MFKKLALGIMLGASFTTLSTSAFAKTLIYCSEASPEGFDQALYTSGVTNDAVAWTLYDRLLEFDSDNGSLVPGLAESWDVSEDGLEYTFHIRKGVKFHTTRYFTPSRELNADDVMFTFERAQNPQHPWHRYMAGVSYQYYDSMGLPELIKDIVKVDDYTVKFVLNHPEAPFLADIAMAFASVNSKEYADQLQKQGKMELFNQLPVGTGPFLYLAYQRDAVIRYRANPDYYLGKPKIDNLVFAITTDANVRAQKLKAGECHMIAYPAPADIKGLRADPNLVVLERAGLNIAYMAYNTMQAPFDKPEVRRALNMAVNKQAIINAVFDGEAVVAKNPLPPTMWGYNDAIKPDEYNPEAAKKMLDDAGVKNLSMKIWAMPVSRPYMPNARRASEIIQADYAKIGVKAEIVTMEWGAYLKQGTAKDRDGAIIMGWTGDNGDPDNFLGVLNSCEAVGTNNYSNWCYKPFNDLILKARTITDQAERAKLYEQAQVIFKEQAPSLLLDHSNIYIPMRKTIKGFKIYPVAGLRFGTVDIEE